MQFARYALAGNQSARCACEVASLLTLAGATPQSRSRSRVVKSTRKQTLQSNVAPTQARTLFISRKRDSRFFASENPAFPRFVRKSVKSRFSRYSVKTAFRGVVTKKRETARNARFRTKTRKMRVLRENLCPLTYNGALHTRTLTRKSVHDKLCLGFSPTTPL